MRAGTTALLIRRHFASPLCTKTVGKLGNATRVRFALSLPFIYLPQKYYMVDYAEGGFV